MGLIHPKGLGIYKPTCTPCHNGKSTKKEKNNDFKITEKENCSRTKFGKSIEDERLGETSGSTATTDTSGEVRDVLTGTVSGQTLHP